MDPQDHAQARHELLGAAFHHRPGFRVAILYPDGRVSPRQAHGLACFGGNVRTFRVAGTRRFISLRWDDMDARFPGLLASLLGAAKREGQNFATPAAKRAARPPSRARAVARRRSAA